MGKTDYSIILPVFNQADHIRQAVGEYLQALSSVPFSWEMILVVNGCRDDSWEQCQALAQASPPICAILSRKAGWGRAVRQGLHAASGDFICYTNSARTRPQDLLLLLLYSYANPKTVIKANRKIRESRQRRIGSLLYNIECRSLFDLPYWDINGTPKVFPREFQHLMNLSREDDLIDLEFHILCRRHRYPMLEIPILSSARRGGRSTTRYASAFRLYWGAFRLRQELNKHPSPIPSD